MKKITHPLLYVLPFLLTFVMLSAFIFEVIGVKIFFLHGGVTGFQILFLATTVADHMSNIIYIWLGAALFWLLFIAVIVAFVANVLLCINHIFQRNWLKAVSIKKVYKLTLVLGWIVVGFFALVGIGAPVVLNALYSNTKVIHYITGTLFYTEEFWPIILFTILVIGRKHVCKHVPQIDMSFSGEYSQDGSCPAESSAAISYGTPAVVSAEKKLPKEKENRLTGFAFTFRCLIKSIFFRKPANIDINAELERYKKLLDDGYISQNDYDVKKAELLNYWW